MYLVWPSTKQLNRAKWPLRLADSCNYNVPRRAFTWQIIHIISINRVIQKKHKKISLFFLTQILSQGFEQESTHSLEVELTTRRRRYRSTTHKWCKYLNRLWNKWFDKIIVMISIISWYEFIKIRVIIGRLKKIVNFIIGELRKNK